MRPMFAALRRYNFRLWATADRVSTAGTWMQVLGVNWYLALLARLSPGGAAEPMPADDDVAPVSAVAADEAMPTTETVAIFVVAPSRAAGRPVRRVLGRGIGPARPRQPVPASYSGRRRPGAAAARPPRRGRPGGTRAA